MSGLVQLAPGASFAGDFRVVRPLAEGAMGAVYVVEQLSTRKQRALKLMQPDLVASADLRRRFEREAQVAASIKSAHVVEVIGAGVDAATGTPWIAMDLLEGDTLADRVERGGPLDVASVREAMGQLGHALAQAHAASIVHRDLKPENVFLCVSQHRGVAFTLKVLDFGIARVTHEARTTSSNTRGSIGTPLWWAPEQATPGAQVGPFTDVWSLGLIAFWLLTGHYFWRSAYVEGASLQMMAMEQFVSPLALPSVRATELGAHGRLPPGFDAWFAATVAREPATRFPDAGQACDAFERLFSQPGDASATGIGGAPTIMAHAASFAPPASHPAIAPAYAPQPSSPSYPPAGRPSAPPTPEQLRQMVASPFAAATAPPVHSVTSPGRSASGGAAVFLGGALVALVAVVVGWLALRSPAVQVQATAASASASAIATEPAVAPSAPVETPSASADEPAPEPPAAPSDVAHPLPHATPPAPKASAAVSAAPKPVAAPQPTAAPPPAALGPPLSVGEVQKTSQSIYGRAKKDCWRPAHSAAPKGSPKTAVISVQIRVDAAGDVTSASGSGGDGYPGLATCVASRARGLHFRPTTAGSFNLTYEYK